MSSQINISVIPRRSFSTVEIAVGIPNLIEVQRQSYDTKFLQLHLEPDKRENQGLEYVFRHIFPISDHSQTSSLEYINYKFSTPKYTLEECYRRGSTFAAPLRVVLSLITWDFDDNTGAKTVKSIKEQEVYIGDIPLMTEKGTFVINGIERVIVSQMHRSPGVFFDHDRGKVHSSGKLLYSARIIPARGLWLDIEFDGKDYINFRIDRKRKMYLSTLLYAFGMSKQDILDYYYTKCEYSISEAGLETDFVLPKSSMQMKDDLVDVKTGEVVVKSGSKLTIPLARHLISQGVSRVRFPHVFVIGKYISDTIIDNNTGEVIVECGAEITEDILTKFNDAGIKNFSVLVHDYASSFYIRDTIIADKNTDQRSAQSDIFSLLRSGDPATAEAAEQLFNSLFSTNSRYDLSEVGRMKINSRINSNIPLDNRNLTLDDITTIIKVLIELKDGKGTVDDIDHLGNRRVRSVGELIENQFMIGCLRLQKATYERINAVDPDSIMPNDLINPKFVLSLVKEFFAVSPLSQFMDQTNPLSEVTHKRRLSALGPGGLSRERAGAEVRDVHITHYGKICPIETPEGQNIGLINSLAVFARINRYGFIETPYRKVVDGVVTDRVEYLSSLEEGNYKIAPVYNEGDSTSVEDLINTRVDGDFVMTKMLDVNYVGVAPMQFVSIATAMIPFLEHNDANRALMGSNMLRQGVPLVQSAAPIVATGVENVVARDSGSGVASKHDGVVEFVSSSKIVVRNTEESKNIPMVEVYNLVKFRKSNHNTCMNDVPIVSVGDVVRKGQIIADGPCMDNGEMAIGKNVLVAFIGWSGYNFKDSIVISESVVRDNIFTSIHIESFEIVARDTRLGPEEITRDIPNVSMESLALLDESGIVEIGAHVKSGDIIVGKVTPKTEAIVNAEEKLLKAIFGEKASDVRDSSFRLSAGIEGTVVDVKIFARRGVEKGQRMLYIERMHLKKLSREKDTKISIIERVVKSRITDLLKCQKISKDCGNLRKGEKISEASLSALSLQECFEILVEDKKITEQISNIKQQFINEIDDVNTVYNDSINTIQMGAELPQGSLKVIKVFIATKHKIQAGDKMSGRYGNKGIVSEILPLEDMPFLDNGRSVDILLNPLGVPSRMNIGQILETHLGWASYNLGKKIGEMVDRYHETHDMMPSIEDFITKIYGKDNDFVKGFKTLDDIKKIELVSSMRDGIYFESPVFDGATISDIRNMLDLAGVDKSGQVRLIDGRTGEYFDRKVTVGYKYMLKLHHLVSEKMHARSTGPYSLVTQQPLGGKAHFGGQRIGEMECWSLQSYGASYVLQEMLTVKSDDVYGRVRIFESIIKGNNNLEYGVPESLNVMLNEFRSLGLYVSLIKKG